MLQDFAVIEYATRSMRAFHLLRRYEPPALALTRAASFVSTRMATEEATTDADAFQSAASGAPTIRLQVSVRLASGVYAAMIYAC
jgi:hypothetical protein